MKPAKAAAAAVVAEFVRIAEETPMKQARKATAARAKAKNYCEINYDNIKGDSLTSDVLPKLLKNLEAAGPSAFPPNFVGIAHGKLQTKKNTSHAFLLHCLGATPAELRRFQGTQNASLKGDRAGAWGTMANMVEKKMKSAGGSEDSEDAPEEAALLTEAQLRKQLLESAGELKQMRINRDKVTKQSEERETKARVAHDGLKEQLEKQAGELTQKTAQLNTQTEEMNELKRKLAAFESGDK